MKATKTELNKIGIFSCFDEAATGIYRENLINRLKHFYSRRRMPEVMTYRIPYSQIKEFEKFEITHDQEEWLINGVCSLHRSGANKILLIGGSIYPFNKTIKELHSVIQIQRIITEKISVCTYQRILVLDKIINSQQRGYFTYKPKKKSSILFPDESDQSLINEIIIHELLWGEVREESRMELLKLTEKYDADFIIAASPALSLLISQTNFKIPVLDTIKIYIDEITNRE